MQEKSFRILNIVAGVLLVAAGIYCLCNQGVAVLSAGLLLGLFMLVSGIIEIVVSARACGVVLGSGWLLLDGVLTVILSLFLLFNQWFTMLMAAGFVCMMDPWVSVAAVGVTVGIVFLLEGVSCIAFACIAKTKDL